MLPNRAHDSNRHKSGLRHHVARKEPAQVQRVDCRFKTWEVLDHRCGSARIAGAVPGLTAGAVRLESPADHVCSRSRPVPPRFPVLTPEAAMGSLHQPVLVNEIVAWLTPLRARLDHRRRDGRRRRSCRGAGAPAGSGAGG